MCMNQSHLVCLWKQGSFCHCSSPDSGIPFLGHTGRLLCLRYSRVVSPTWSQTLPPLLLLCLFFEHFSPFLFPPWCEFMCGWFSWAHSPAQLQSCLLFVLTALRSVLDTLWSASPEQETLLSSSSLTWKAMPTLLTEDRAGHPGACSQNHCVLSQANKESLRELSGLC